MLGGRHPRLPLLLPVLIGRRLVTLPLELLELPVAPLPVSVATLRLRLRPLLGGLAEIEVVRLDAGPRFGRRVVQPRVGGHDVVEDGEVGQRDGGEGPGSASGRWLSAAGFAALGGPVLLHAGPAVAAELDHGRACVARAELVFTHRTASSLMHACHSLSCLLRRASKL